jgi:hypothetical protein
MGQVEHTDIFEWKYRPIHFQRTSSIEKSTDVGYIFRINA